MNAVMRRLRPTPAGASRKWSRHRHPGRLSRRLNEKSPAGREDRLSQ